MNAKLTKLAAGIVLSFGIAGAAHAGAVGTAYLEITNLLFKKTDGTVLKLGTDISPAGSGLRNTGDVSSTLTPSGGSPTTDSATGDQPAAATFDVGTSTLGNNGFACVGDCNYTDDSFSYLTSPSDVPSSSYVVNDVAIFGAAIDLGLGTTGADAYALAESAIVPDNVGSAEGNVGLSATFSFVSTTTSNFDFTFDYEAYLRSALLNVPGVSAEASLSWQITLRDQTATKTYSYNLSADPSFVTGNISTGLSGDDIVESFSATNVSVSWVNALVKGNSYRLTIDHEVTADSEAIPEPATLALMGIGMLGLGASLRRRAKQA